ncbi:MAG: hypothetical protein FJY98_03735 [Candidatus Liptonbacteria bacterium]|nr:hypothetical protein [Candidatus Liptonbacteria bacterium]
MKIIKAQLKADLFPASRKGLGWLLGTGICFAVGFAAKGLLLNPLRFEASGGEWNGYLTNYFFPSLFSALTLWLWIVIQKTKELPPKTFLLWIMLFGLLFAGIAALSNPTIQDIYWSMLLTKGWVMSNLNPYLTTPNMLSGDPWLAPFLDFKDSPMIYGPLWVYLVAGAIYVGKSFAGSLFFIKLVMLAIFLCIGIVLRRIMHIHRLSPQMQNILLLLLAWNPFILQTLITDAHSDALILLSILVSYLFFKEKKYGASAGVLLVGGFAKYTSLFLLPIPLFYLLWKSTFSLREKAVRLGGIVLLALGMGILLYAPFGGFETVLGGGMRNALLELGSIPFSLFPTMAIATTLNFDTSAIRLLGLLVGIFLMCWYLKKDNSLLAYSFPFLGIFIFGTPWFLPWYTMWIFPLLLLIFSPLSIILVSSLLILTPTVISPLTGSYIVASIYIGWKLLSPHANAPAPRLTE